MTASGRRATAFRRAVIFFSDSYSTEGKSRAYSRDNPDDTVRRLRVARRRRPRPPPLRARGGAQQNAGDKRGEVNAMNDNSTNRVEAGATSPDNSAPRNANDARADATTDASAQKSQLDLKTSIRRDAGGDIVVEYSVTNRGARAVLLLNRGDTSLGLGPG